MKSFATILLRSLLFLLIFAALVPKNLTARSNSDKPDDPLVFRIIPENSTLPSGSKFINIEVELRNTGQKPVRLSPVGIGAHVNVANKPCSVSDGIRNQSISADPLPSFRATTIISIPSGGTYQQTMKLDLSPEFFTPGMYSISMYFSGSSGGSGMKDVYTGDLKSNEVFFEIAEPENAGYYQLQRHNPRSRSGIPTAAQYKTWPQVWDTTLPEISRITLLRVNMCMTRKTGWHRRLASRIPMAGTASVS